VREDRAQEYEQATAVFDQWTRAEPDFRPWTAEELDAWMAARDAEFRARKAERDRQRAAQVVPLRRASRAGLVIFRTRRLWEPAVSAIQ
jgi:hypothetical protein